MTQLRLFAAPQPVAVRVGGHTVTVPAVDADVWLRTVAADDWHVQVCKLLPAADQVVLARALAQASLTEADLVTFAKDAIAGASGMEWWRAMRIALSSPGVWGALVLRGVDPGRQTFAGWLAAVVALLHENRDDAERAKVDMALDVPPEGETSSAWDMDPSAWA